MQHMGDQDSLHTYRLNRRSPFSTPFLLSPASICHCEVGTSGRLCCKR